jgi:hypothetical protein
MHTKINIHRNDPNFLTHVIWSKTSTRDATYTPRTMVNLIYAFLKKNKHNSRINISGNYKIVVNSLEVCFGITRQYAKVGCKNLIIFIYKNPLCRSCKNGKQFL